MRVRDPQSLSLNGGGGWEERMGLSPSRPHCWERGVKRTDPQGSSVWGWGGRRRTHEASGWFLGMGRDEVASESGEEV